MKNTSIKIWKSSQSGYGMLEVLISITIASFGLLGMAGLQAASLRYQKTAHFRSIASIAMSDISERMYANAQGVRNGKYASGSEQGFDGDEPVCTDLGACTTNEIARFDLFSWHRNLKRDLPEGYGEISGNAENGVTIKVCFSDPGAQENTSERTSCFETMATL